jgi:hypothetical protein
MSFLRTATASSSRAATGVRALSTSAPAAAAPARRGTGPKNRKAFELNDLETYAFDDAPALGHLRLIQIDRVRELVSKMKADKAVLAGEFEGGLWDEARTFQSSKVRAPTLNWHFERLGRIWKPLLCALGGPR